MLNNSQERYEQKHYHSKRESGNYMASKRKHIRNHAKQISEQNEKENREDERKILPSLSSDIVVNQTRNK